MPVLRFIEPCLPSPADRPPSGSGWLHEIKHDGYRLMARRDPVGIRLITRRGNDWTSRFPRVAEARRVLKTLVSHPLQPTNYKISAFRRVVQHVTSPAGYLRQS